MRKSNKAQPIDKMSPKLNTINSNPRHSKGERTKLANVCLIPYLDFQVPQLHLVLSWSQQPHNSHLRGFRRAGVHVWLEIETEVEDVEKDAYNFEE